MTIDGTHNYPQTLCDFSKISSSLDASTELQCFKTRFKLGDSVDPWVAYWSVENECSELRGYCQIYEEV